MSNRAHVGDVANALAQATRVLEAAGLLDAFGHLSVRYGSGFLIPSTAPTSAVAATDIMHLDLQGHPITADPRPRHAEVALHAGIYAARPDVGAICHTHGRRILPFTVTDVDLVALTHTAAAIGHVARWDSHNDFGDTDLLVRNADQAASLATALAMHRVVLMRGHGAVVVGDDLDSAVVTSIALDRAADVQLAVAQLGPARPLSSGERQQAARMLSAPLASEKILNYWRTKI